MEIYDHKICSDCQAAATEPCSDVCTDCWHAAEHDVEPKSVRLAIKTRNGEL